VVVVFFDVSHPRISFVVAPLCPLSGAVGGLLYGLDVQPIHRHQLCVVVGDLVASELANQLARNLPIPSATETFFCVTDRFFFV